MATFKEIGGRVGELRTVVFNGETAAGNIVDVDDQHVYIAGLPFGREVTRTVGKADNLKLRAFDLWADIFKAEGLSDWAKVLLHRARLGNIANFITGARQNGNRT